MAVGVHESVVDAESDSGDMSVVADEGVGMAGEVLAEGTDRGTLADADAAAAVVAAAAGTHVDSTAAAVAAAALEQDTQPGAAKSSRTQTPYA